MNEFTLDKFLGRYGAVAQRSEPGEGIAPAVAGSNPARAARAHTLCPWAIWFSLHTKRSFALGQGRVPASAQPY